MRKVRRLAALGLHQWIAVGWSLLLLPALGMSIRSTTVARTQGWLARRSDVPLASSPARLAAAREAAMAVDLVATRRMTRSACLVRSLALWFIVRRSGTEAQLVIGAAPVAVDGTLPAHAWVEIEGVPINDRADVRERFPVFERPRRTRSA